MKRYTATLTKLPTAEVIAAQSSTETPRQVAKRLGVRFGFVRTILVSQNFTYELLDAALWSRPMIELRAAVDAWASDHLCKGG